MKILVIYASENGQTRRIADYIGERIEAKGDTARLIEASASIPDLKFSDYAGIIVAGPVYRERHPEDLISLVKAHAKEVANLPSAFVSVSLAAAFPDGETEAKGYVSRFLRATGWQPSAIHRAAGALRYERYDFFQEQILRHIVLKDRPADMVEGNNEFTDWDALANFNDEFIEKAGTDAN